jgi:hypothetical protein
VPADRYFGKAAEVLQTLRARVAANALELARHGVPKPPFYMTGQVAGQAFSVHAEGERVVLTREGSARQEIELVSPAAATPNAEPAATSASLPQPICPDGSPAGELGHEEPPLPGESCWEEGVRSLDGLSEEASSCSAKEEEGGDA